MSRTPKYTIEDMQASAAAKGGRCLSETPQWASEHAEWECAAGHRWTSAYRTVLKGRWCRKCGNAKKCDGIEVARAFARSRGGECLSPAYVPTPDKMLWRCAKGHEWEAVFYSVKRGCWCPTCASYGPSRGEQICRSVLGMMFRADFPTAYPAWLRLKKGRGLELDGYNAALGIAFEYQGSQHYRPSSPGGRFTTADVLAIQERDGLKRRACVERGVRLIVVPQFPDLGDLAACMDRIEAAVVAAGLEMPAWERPADIPDLWRSLTDTFDARAVQDMHLVAASRGGRLVSDAMNNGLRCEKLTWMCEKGHEWEAKWNDIKRGNWCDRCSRPVLFDGVEALRAIAAERGGLCLETDYRGSRVKARWECFWGHRWSATWAAVKQGRWCPGCNAIRQKSTRKTPSS